MTSSHFLPRTLALVVVAIIMVLTQTSLVSAQSAGCSVDIIRSDQDVFEMDVDILDLDIQAETQSGFERNYITIAGEQNAGAPGFPELPHISRLVVVPPTSHIELSWTGDISRMISATPPSIVTYDDPGSNSALFQPPDITTQSGFWPEQVVEMGKPAIMRGIRVVRITVNPVQVDPLTGDLKVWENINVKLNFTAGEAINPVVNADRPRPSKIATRLLRSLVVNPEAIRRDDGKSGSYVYIIPEYNGVREAIEPLINWRKRQGYPTEVIVISDDDDSNVDVKHAIEEAYFEWEIPPEYICLIGDADTQNAQFKIATWDVGRAYMWETDYRYVLLEGDDLLPEMAIGRISARSVNELQNVINNKIIPYEVDPYLDNTDWYGSAALMSNDQRTGYSSIYLQRWLSQTLREVGFAEVDTFYFVHNNQVSGHQFIENSINEGISFFCYRGWGQFNGAWSVGDADDLRNERMLPFILMPTCNTGDFADHVQFPNGYTEDFLWGGRGGAIGSIGSSGFTHTNYNNVFAGGVVNSFYRDGAWEFGWALNLGKLELYRHFGMFNDVDDPQVNSLKCWEAHAYQNNLIGDPATQIWTSVPQAISVEHDDVISIGENQLIISVEDPETDTPIIGATVTLLFDEELIRAAETDATGNVIFTFPMGELSNGLLDLTVTMHDKIPYLAEIPVDVEDSFLGVLSFIIDDDNAGQSHGNADHKPNPGERIELRTYIANFGESVPDGGIDFSIEVISGAIDIINGDAHLDNAPQAGDSALVTFIVDMDYETFNGQRIVLSVNAANNDFQWRSPIEFKTTAADLECVDFSFNPQNFNVGDTVQVNVTLHNEGSISSPEMLAELVSLQEAVVVFDPYAEISPIAVENGDTLAEVSFVINARTQAIPGTPVKMLLVFESMEGFIDTASFNFVLDQAEVNTPFGPDAYGYGCFDDTDENWDIAPAREWIEIDPEFDGPGIDTEINDIGNERDWSILVDLPFTFRYYGGDFDELTICSNGWFSLGDQSKLCDFQNRRIPPALGPRAQVCVFWDDLVNLRDGDTRIGGIYYWYDVDNNRFIIEWSRMRRYIGVDDQGHIREGSENTFQAILYDPQHYQTYTGDGDIVFQYHTVHNDQAVDPSEFDTPFATVGIVNLNGTDGMEYTYWNEYPAGAAELQDGRAIKFTTALIIATGNVTGTVIDAATDDAIEGAEIRGNPTSFGITNINGEFNFSVLVGEDYTFTAWAPGYNELTIEDVDISEGQTEEIHFALTHPEFALSDERIEMALAPDNATVVKFSITNSGNGPLTYRSYFEYAGGGEIWQRLTDFNVTEITGDNRIQGIAFLDDYIWVTGSNNNQNPNMFYRFGGNGEPVGHLAQPTESNYGFRGMAVVGDIVYGGEMEYIVGVNAEGEAVDSLPGPHAIQRAIAWDSDSETFWVANSTDPLLQLDMDGNVLDSYHHELEIHGLGFLNNDADGYPLYIASQNKTNPDLEVPEALISKFDPESGDFRVEAVLSGNMEDRVEGIEVVSNLDPQKLLLLAIMSNPNGDRVSIYDLGPNTNWINIDPRFAEIPANGIDTIRVSLNSRGLEIAEYQLAIRFAHNAAGLETMLPVVLTVDPNAGLENRNTLPGEFGLNNNYPNPFNSTTRIDFSVSETSAARISLFDLTGREIDVITDNRFTAGKHSVVFNSASLPSGIYIVRLDAGNRTAQMKIALIR
ncbi:carboxypeptidase regulatory-like domain-containing protein [bacterium]|nr:carboxypeptidase regulatory-like domain-containing protein [bacterium]